MSETGFAKLRATSVAVGPFSLLAALLYHPYIADLTDVSSVAAAMDRGNSRWAVAHIAVGVGFGLLLLSFLAVRSHLRAAGEERWSSMAVPFLVMGTVLFTFLPAMEVAMAAATRAGADPVATQVELNTWFVPLLMSGALVFGIGIVLMAMATVRSGVLGRDLGRIVATALVVGALTRFVPRGAALYAGSVAAVIALLPFAIQMWSGEARARIGGRSVLAASRGGAR